MVRMNHISRIGSASIVALALLLSSLSVGKVRALSASISNTGPGSYNAINFGGDHDHKNDSDSHRKDKKKPKNQCKMPTDHLRRMRFIKKWSGQKDKDWWKYCWCFDNNPRNICIDDWKNFNWCFEWKDGNDHRNKKSLVRLKVRKDERRDDKKPDIKKILDQRDRNDYKKFVKIDNDRQIHDKKTDGPKRYDDKQKPDHKYGDDDKKDYGDNKPAFRPSRNYESTKHDSDSPSFSYRVNNDNDVDINNRVTQTAVSGDAVVAHNTSGGAATSGDASNYNSSSTSVSINN